MRSTQLEEGSGQNYLQASIHRRGCTGGIDPLRGQFLSAVKAAVAASLQEPWGLLIVLLQNASSAPDRYAFDLRRSFFSTAIWAKSTL